MRYPPEGIRGMGAGILATDPALAQQYLDAGALFVVVGVARRCCSSGSMRVPQRGRHRLRVGTETRCSIGRKLFF